MKKMKESMNALLILAGEIVIGVLLLIDPGAFLSVIMTAIGAVLMVCGAVSVIRYLRAAVDVAIMQHMLSRGLMQMAAGALLAFGTPWLLTIFPLMTTLCGAGMLLIGIMKIQQTADFARLRLPCWKAAAVNAALTMLAALVLMLNPFGVVNTLWAFAGIALIVIAVSDMATLIVRNRRVKE